MTRSGLILAANLAMLLPVSSHALGIRIADQSAKATARGNAFAATADDPSAIYYNPAGLTQLDGHNVLLGGYAVSLKSEYRDLAGNNPVETESDIHALPQLFYSYSFADVPLSLGLGVYSPYGLGLEWPDNPTFRALEGNITYMTVNPTVAWKLHETFSIGAGFRYNHADAELRQMVAPAPAPLQSRFEGDGEDIGFNVGLLWQPHEQHSFGLNYFSASRVRLKGSSQVTFLIPKQPASATFQFPQHIVAGWSFRPTPKWNLEVNVDWTDWDSLNSVIVRQAVPGDQPLVFDWQSSFFYEFGATYQVCEYFDVSAGYIYSENSVPELTFTPTVPDSDRHILSFGVGGRYKQLRWDAAYQFAYGPERTIDSSAQALAGIPGAANGRYEFTSHALSLALGYSF